MFVIVFVIVIVFVFVIVFLLVRSSFLITLITCLKGHKSLRVLYGSVFQKCVVVSESVSESVSDKVTYRAVWGQLKTSFWANNLQIFVKYKGVMRKKHF